MFDHENGGIGAIKYPIKELLNNNDADGAYYAIMLKLFPGNTLSFGDQIVKKLDLDDMSLIK